MNSFTKETLNDLKTICEKICENIISLSDSNIDGSPMYSQHGFLNDDISNFVNNPIVKYSGFVPKNEPKHTQKSKFFIKFTYFRFEMSVLKSRPIIVELTNDEISENNVKVECEKTLSVGNEYFNDISIISKLT